MICNRKKPTSCDHKYSTIHFIQLNCTHTISVLPGGKVDMIFPGKGLLQLLLRPFTKQIGRFFTENVLAAYFLLQQNV